MWPWDWISAAGSGLSGLTQKAVNWVNSLIASVMSWVNDAVNAIWRGITAVWHGITGVWSSTISFVVSTADAIYRWFDHLIHTISDWVLSLVNQLWQFIQGVYTWALNQINALWKYVFQFSRDIYSWVLRNIWDPLYHDYQDAVNWATQQFNQVWQYIEHPEMLASLIGRYLLASGIQLAERFAVPVTRWIVRSMRSMAGEVFDLLESVISSII